MFLCATRPNCRLGPLAMGGKGPGNHLGMKKGRLTAAFFHSKNAIALLDRRDHMPIPALVHPADRLRPGHRGGRYGRKGLPILGRAGVSPPEGYQSRFALGLFPRPWFFPGFGGRGYPLPYHKAHLMGRGLWEGSRTIRACAYSSQPRACPQRSQNFWYSRSKVIWQRGQTGKVFPSRNRKTWVTGIGLRKDFAEARSGFC